MKSRSYLGLIALGALGSMLVGCGAGRDVEVSGSVSAPTTAQGEIQLEFYQIAKEGESAERVHTATLDAAGPFKETVDIEGDSVRVLGIADSNGDGACSAGEAWGEVTATIAADDTVQPVNLVLKNAPCPSAN